MNQTELKKIDAYWRASNYLAAGQLYLLDNPLLRRPLTRDDVKKKIVGHWGTVPGQNFVYVHLNRVIKQYDQDMVLISGPGHGGNFFVANAHLDGTYSEVYPNISRDEEGMKKLFKQFSFPGGISSHVAPETPGSINEGGELGYSIAHAFGAAFDNPDLIVACTVGDGEAETGPKVVDGKPIEGTFRAHQVPIDITLGTPHQEEHLKQIEEWLHCYHPEELFDKNGTLIPELQKLAPTGDRRIAANPHANGGKLLRDLRTPDFKQYAVDIPFPGSVEKQDMIELGGYIRDVFKLNADAKNFRIFGPDETMSNRLYKCFEATERDWNSTIVPNDEFLAHDGRIMDSMLSEHLCEGWLEGGYLLTGRHGFFASYESFIRVVDSMVTQHAKWLKVCNQLPWRQSIASLNLILSSNVWQQDHNGYTHQDPGFLDHIANKKADVVRLYLPPDTNCLLSCFDHCIRSRDYVNVLVTSKHPRPQWLTMEQAVKHCTQGVGIWDWASTDAGEEPDIVMACCGDTPTLETLAAVTILRDALPELKIRVVNVVDLMKLEPNTKHPHGLSDADYNALFTKDKPIIFAFHGYPTLVHELTYERANRNLSVHGYQEEGTITTPFDMRVQNEIDRFYLVKDAVLHLPQLGNRGAYLVQQMNDKLVEHKNYIHEVGQDMPEILDWKWHI